MRRATDRFVRPALDSLHKTVILSAMLVGGIIFLGKKSQAVENNTAAIAAIQVKNMSQDTSISDIKETLKTLAYLACSEARKQDPTLTLPAECSKVISDTR